MHRHAVAPAAVLAALLAAMWWSARAPVGSDPAQPAAETGVRAEPAPLAGLAAPPEGHHPRATEAAGPDALAPEDDATAAAGDVDPEASLCVVTVDAATGLALPCTWNTGTGDVVGAPWPPGVEVTEAMLRAQQEGVQRSIEAWEHRFLPSGETRPGGLAYDPLRDGWTVPDLTIRPPPGYAPPERDVPADLLAAKVHAATVIVPVHREVPLRLRVLAPDGRPAADANLLRVCLAGHPCAVTTEALAPGEIRVHGIPHLPGEALLVEMEGAAGGAAEEAVRVPATTETPRGGGARTIRVPDDPSAPWEEFVRLEGPTDGWVLDRTEIQRDRPPPTPFPLDFVVPADGPVGALRVVVLGWDGSPLAGARILDGTTDRSGVALLEGLPTGERFLSNVPPPGRFCAGALVEIRAGARAEATLREPRGGTLDLLVTDEDGAPRPSARFAVEGGGVFDAADGVQRLDRWTDARGRRTLARVEPGRLRISAVSGSRRGEETIEVRDGERTSVHVVVR